MTEQKKDRLRFALFTSFAPAGAPGTPWDHPQAVAFDYLSLDHWIRLCKALEAAKFDAIFWADQSSAHDTYQGSWAATLREAIQFPLGDPILLTAALASSTENLGFAFSSSIIQDYPYGFARRLSTLDHLTRGRIAWNIVTSFQQASWRNFGHEARSSHGARYEQAEEYVTVLYKLLEGSWADDTVKRDTVNRIFADPSRVREIAHKGEYYSVPGIHTNEPSPQRTPVLFQAGSSDDGRQFAARNAEAMFIVSKTPNAAQMVIKDMHSRLASVGRRSSDILFFQHTNFIVGATEEEALKKDAEASEFIKDEANLIFYSSTLGTDLSKIDIDRPIGDFQPDTLQGTLKGLIESIPNKTLTFRDAMVLMTKNRLVGAPEQIAAKLEEWRAAGVHGINVGFVTGMNDVHRFIEHVTPLLKERGLMQKEYAPGTMREKLFVGTESPSGPRLNERHPAAHYRQAPAFVNA